MRYFVTLGFVLLAGVANAQSPQELRLCRQISDSLQRLACFDRVVPLAATQPKTATPELSVVDYMTDAQQLRGKQVRVKGFGIAAGEGLFLYTSRGDVNAIQVNLGKVDREGRRLALSKCGSGCEIVINGQATQQFGMSGIAATSIEIQ